MHATSARPRVLVGILVAVLAVVVVSVLVAWRRSSPSSAPFAGVPERVAPTDLKLSVAGFRKAIEYDNLPGATPYLSIRCKAELGSTVDAFLRQFKTGDERAFQFSSFVEHPQTSESASLVDYQLGDGPIRGFGERWVRNPDDVWYFDDCRPAAAPTSANSSP